MRGSQGFTLLEVLVSLAILGTAVAIVLQLFAANIRAVVSSEDYVAASVFGEGRMRALLESDGLSEPAAWTEKTEGGHRLDVLVSEVLKEKTENLPVRLLQVDMRIRWTRGFSEKSIRLKSLKMVSKGEAVPGGPAAVRP